MKKLFFLFFLMFLSGISNSQIKQRSSDISIYSGIGYKFVFLTDPVARNSYPFFEISNGNFLKELDGFLGVSINDKVAIEFSPAYLFSNSLSSDGFYFQDSRGYLFYLPVQTSLFSVPLNLRLKYFPFSNSLKSALSKVYIGGGGGFMYISEEITSQIYSDNIRVDYLGIRSYQNDFWTNNFEILLGINSFSKFGFGFELSYRFVPLNEPKTIPLITSISGNLNSANFMANIVFSF